MARGWRYIKQSLVWRVPLLVIDAHVCHSVCIIRHASALFKGSLRVSAPHLRLISIIILILYQQYSTSIYFVFLFPLLVSPYLSFVEASL